MFILKIYNTVATKL